MNRSNVIRPHWCRLASLATAALLLASTAAGARADDSLARFVPADIGLFAEVRGAEDLLTALTEPQIWTTLAELAGQPARPEDAAEWRLRVRQTVKMEPEDAIRVLFARGVAFVGEGPGRAQDAVVVCRPAEDVTIKELRKRWRALRLRQPAHPPTYRLHNNIGVTDHRGVLFFGDLLPPEGMFRRVQRFATDTQAKSLADDPVYRKLLARVPERPDGVLFARLGQAAPILVPPVPAGSQPSSQPAVASALPDLPGPLHNAENVMLALHRDGPLLHFTAVGDANGQEKALVASPVRLLERLPERTLLAWQGRVDFADMSSALERLPEHNPVRVVFKLHEQVEVLDQFVKTLGITACLAVGVVFPPGRSPGAPPMPAVALLVGTRDAAAAGQELRNVINVCVAGYTVFALARGVAPLPPIRETRLGGTPAFVLDLSSLLKPTAKEGIGQVHFCWMVHEDVLVIASQLDWLRQIADAREGRAANLSKVTELTRGKLTPRSVNAIVIQSGPIADIGGLWVEYLQRTKPEMFDEKWWRDRQPGGANVRLGINVTPDAPNRRLRVEQVLKNQPADGRLRVGDFIVGYDNRRFASDDLISEIRTAIRERPHARWLELLIERDGVTVRKSLPLPFIDPILALQRLIAIGKIAQRVVYHDDHSDAAGLRGFLTIELRKNAQPLFEFPRPVPIGSTNP